MKKGTPSLFSELSKTLTDYSESGSIKKIELLNACSKIFPKTKNEIKLYHSSLLFLLSYPDNHEVHKPAQQEMKRLTNTIESKPVLKEQLLGSGIAGTITQSTYTLALITWLIKEFPGSVALHSFDEAGIHPKEILKLVLPEAEFELVTDEKLNPVKWLEKASGIKNKAQMLKWLIDVMHSARSTDLIKDHLFESLKLFIEINPTEKFFSSSYGRIETSETFFHKDGIIKKFNEQELITKELPAEKKLNEAQKKEIIKASRIALCLLNRETDPITYSEEQNIKYFELERGLSIALFSMDAERRMPLESYIGFIMFKNGYPMAYGGAWLFGKRSLIGINIFEPFRGGESAIVFAQLLRCYHKSFGASYFEVEPYQFGKDNPEGIQSGAFLFYYRFGFRPCDKDLFNLSLSEHKKITEAKGYRSSGEILKQFTKSNLFAHFSENTEIPVNPSVLSKYVTHKINTDFKGNRESALKWCLKMLKHGKVIDGTSNKTGADKLSLFIGLCFDLKKANAKEHVILQKLIHAKGDSEFAYIALLNSFAIEKFISDKAKRFLS